ncbi:MAG: hypothetical protein IT368_10470 [Candidatus Hydrogenedentes bacterium]|nr:hypothetical protein [Candidatus Hydrogenedentota bacterium]
MSHWSVNVDGKPVPVYAAVVRLGGPAFFCNFETDGPAHITATPNGACYSAVVRPLSKGIVPHVSVNRISFDIEGPCKLSVEPNNDIIHPLFLFANPIERDIPDPNSPDVQYFGPGLHEVSLVSLNRPGTMVYVHAGAYIRAVLPPEETPTRAETWAGVPEYQNFINANGVDHVTIRGRGIIDMSALPRLGRRFAEIAKCRDVYIEGVTVLDSPHWTIFLSQSERVVVENVKLIGNRENADGVNIVNSREINVRDCFVRTGDDGIVVKTFTGRGEARDIVVEGCVLWNDLVRTIGITAETAEPVRNVCFRDIDIIHDLTTDFDQGWTMAVYMSDSGPVEDICFERIRCEDTRRKFIEVVIAKDQWSTSEARGQISRILFRDIHCLGANKPASLIKGYDEEHLVRDVRFENLLMDGRPVLSAEQGNFHINEHVRNITFAESATADTRHPSPCP